MAKIDLRVRKNRDGSVTVRVGSYMESFDPRGLSRFELYEKVRWACVAGDLSVEDETVYAMLRANGLMA